MNGKQVCTVCLIEINEDDLIIKNAKDPGGGLVWNKNGDMHVAGYKKRKKFAIVGYSIFFVLLLIIAIVMFSILF